MPQHACLLRASSHHDCHIIGFNNRVEYARSQVATRTHTKHLSFEKPDHEREKATIQQDKGSLLIQRAKLGFSTIADPMINIGGDQVAITVTAKPRDNLQRLLKVVIVKV